MVSNMDGVEIRKTVFRNMRMYFLVAGILLFMGCGNSTNQLALQIPEQGLSFKIEQKNSVTLASVPTDLRVEIGKITRGQTLLTIWSQEEMVHREALQEKKSVPFVWNGEKLMIECVQLDNELTGPDFAHLRLTKGVNNTASQPVKVQLTEKEKILRLIDITEKSQMHFIRNDVRYTSIETAELLRNNYSLAESEIRTAQEFIINIASKSSATGEIYYAELMDGSVLRAEDWYRDRLREVNQ